MFFIMGINQGRKVLGESGLMICDKCGSYGRYQVFMTYMYLSLFFIPCIKWNRKYYVQTSCCNAVYELDPEIGRAFSKGEQQEIRPEHLTLVQEGTMHRAKRCPSCGYETREDFEFCPKCGRKLEL